MRVSVDQTKKRHCYIFKDIPKEAYFKGRRIPATTVVRSICQETGGTCEERARSDHLASAGKTAMQGDLAGTGCRRAIFRHVPDEGTRIRHWQGVGQEEPKARQTERSENWPIRDQLL